ncbi:tetratricopeptide repeat protein [Sorangium sp. So ce426]|uniref:tetratricopeptide repeat protein n=1 Tax=Sorangium sp. So ce426 TaxID=3133312 RepID=UPI003F5CB642
MLDIDADGRVDALWRAVAWSESFALIFVHVPPGPARDELLDRFQAWSGRDGMPDVLLVTLGAAERPFDKLEKLGLGDAGRTAVVLVGLEQCDVGARVSPALAELNFARDLLPRLVPGPLVLMASDEVFDALLRSAPDLFTWRQFEISVRAAGEPQAQREERAHAHLPPSKGSLEEAQAEVARLSKLLQGVVERRTGHGDLEGARVRLRLGRALLDAYRYDEADVELRGALEAYRAAGEAKGEADSLHAIGLIALHRADYEQARLHFEKALPLYRRIGDALGEANCIHDLGDIALNRSNHEQARLHFEQALPLYRRIGSVLSEANCVQGLGIIALQHSDYEQARTHFEQALPLCRRVGNVLAEANCILNLGDVARDRSDHDAARACYEQALRLFQRLSEPYSIGLTHERLARIATDADLRRRHVEAAHAAWASIGRLDPLEELVPGSGNDPSGA